MSSPIETWIRTNRPGLIAEFQAASPEFSRDMQTGTLLLAVAKIRNRAVRIAIVEAMEATVLAKERVDSSKRVTRWAELSQKLGGAS